MTINQTEPEWPTAPPAATPKPTHHNGATKGARTFAAILGLVILAAFAIAAASSFASSFGGSRSQPSSVVPGTSLVGFEHQMGSWLAEPQPKGWAVTGIASIDCALPKAGRQASFSTAMPGATTATSSAFWPLRSSPPSPVRNPTTTGSGPLPATRPQPSVELVPDGA